ncbi:demethylmenaquinone methyltransferase/2-methoxy-6-polyprenyl-1,4-benzoquinol methylase [Microbacterium sp. SLBN-154]|uniref:class I SAM-dependent methyltransferase n=1 Tax=Microbacterium sp. SLBN-154 TaxID=2768458 RepID=UPI001150F4D5|nr:methyltransferase domain-containing protein [Microbacterium sp. SLBN-154]TQK20771.1 demethylmenaquinone methyltransferase/2-methoxy-6-polyprenyl-1,4-benzoquinol methylase [Microbacterium sp. SLBN-154]
MSRPFRRYSAGARLYDVLSGERWVYRAGRVAGIELMGLRSGDVVLDLGCGTGLNFPLVRAAVGRTGHIVGVDRSADMLAVAWGRVRREGWSNVTLVEADAADLDAGDVRARVAAATGSAGGVDAVLSTYALSVMRDGATEAWARAVDLVRPDGVLAVVDMQPPTGRWRIFSPLARLACAVGGADIRARPWRLVARDADPGSVREVTVRGGHIVTAVGRLPGEDASATGS